MEFLLKYTATVVVYDSVRKFILSLTALASLTMATGCLDSNANWRWEKKKAVPAPTPAPETVWQPMQINTEPQGAAIVFNGNNVGYSPITVNIEVVKSTGKMSGMFSVQAIPTGPNQYTQYASNFADLFLGDGGRPAPPAIIMYMYNHKGG